MSLRVPSAILAVLAVVFAVTAWRAGASPDLAGAVPPTQRTPLLSARRLPGLLIASQRDPVLIDHLKSIVEDGPGSTCVSVEIDGRPVYTHNANLPVTPASNEKLVTAQLALQLLGPKHRYTTLVSGPKAISGNVQGDIHLVGGGDPVLGSDEWREHFADQPAVVTPLATLADRVADAGITRITGSVVGDESRYDSLRSVPTWPSRYVDQRQLGPISALTVNGGLTSFPAHATELNRTDVTLAENPPRHAAEIFTQLLAERGVSVDGGARAGKAPAGEEQIAMVSSPPLTDIVRHMLSESDNQVAEMLVKEMGVANGKGGTTASGVAAMRKAIEELGVSATGIVLNDGSGLDEGDRLTCTLIAELLSRAGEDSAVGQGLAVAGESGTLRDRFTDDELKGRLRAKTGTLNDVTALSGFATSTGGAGLTFAYVANGELVGPQLLELQTRLAEALVDYTGPVALAEIGPS